MSSTAPTEVEDERPEIPAQTAERIASWRRIFGRATAGKDILFEQATRDLARDADRQDDDGVRLAIIDELGALAIDAAIDPDQAQTMMANAFGALAEQCEVCGSAPCASPSFCKACRDEDARRASPEPPAATSPDEYGALTVATAPAAPAPALFKTPAQWPHEAPPPVDWLAAQRIPRGDVTTLHGDGGAGKTDVALRLAANVARGAQDWLGHQIAQGPVVVVSAEEPEREVRRRVWLHGARGLYSPGDLTDLHLWFPDDASHDTVLAVPNRYGIMEPTALFDSLGVAIHKLQPVLIVVDNVAATFAGNQNDRVMVRTYVNLWRFLARIDSKPAVLLIDHPSLSGITNGTGRGGNMDWRNAVRSALYLRLPEERAEADRGIRILETQKSNYGPSGNPLRLQWAEGGLEREETPSSFHRLAKDQECEQLFLRMLDERNAQGRHVGSKTSAMYAPKEFATAPNSGDFTKQAFAAAMQRLFTAGTIHEAYDAQRRHAYIDRAPAPLAEAAE